MKQNKKYVAEPGLSDLVSARTLDNGFRIFVIPDHAAETVCAQIWVGTGSIDEGKFLGCGLSHFLEHMLFSGTKNFPGPHEIADTVTRCGGGLNAFTSYSVTSYYMDMPSAHIGLAVDMLSDMVSAPLFPETAFQKEKEVILRECAMRDDNPDSVLFESLFSSAYRIHPIRVPIIGRGDLIRTVDRAKMCEYYALRYSPHCCFAVVVGDVEPDAVMDRFAERLGSWACGSLAQQPRVQEPPQIIPCYTETFFPDPQARFALGWKTLGDAHPDKPALDVLSAVLGGGESSRLIRTLRTRLELVSDVRAFHYGNANTGLAMICGEAEPGKVDAAAAEVQNVIRNLRQNGITAAELNRIKTTLETDYWTMLRSSNRQVASAFGQAVVNTGNPRALDLYRARLRTVTAEEAVRAAETYFSEDSLTRVIMRPASTGGKSGKQTAKTKPSTLSRTMPERVILPSGRRLLLLPDNRSPLVDMTLLLRGGTAFESEENAGCSDLLEECLFTGCGPYSEEAFADFLEDHGLRLSVGASRHGITVVLTCLREQWKYGLRAVRLMLSKPKFPASAFARELVNLKQDCRSELTDPRDVAIARIRRMFFGNHPYGRSGYTVLENIAGLSRDTMVRYFRETVLSGPDACFAISGALSEDEIRAAVDELDAAIPWSDGPGLMLPSAPVFPQNISGRAYAVPREQAVPVYAMPAPAFGTADEVWMALAADAMNGMGGRLFQEIREKAGLAYYTGLSALNGFECGMNVMYAGARPDTVAEVLRKFESERLRMVDAGLSEAELVAARSRELFRLESKARTAAGRMDLALTAEYLGVGMEWGEQKKKMLAEATCDEVHAAIRRYFGGLPRRWAVASPEKFTEKMLFS